MTTIPDSRPTWLANLAVERTRLSRIADLALPIIAGAVATNLMGFIDTLMVGRLGNSALGGVGIGSQLFFLLLAVALGLAAGVQALVARRVGEGRLEVTGKVLNAASCWRRVSGRCWQHSAMGC